MSQSSSVLKMLMTLMTPRSRRVGPAAEGLETKHLHGDEIECPKPPVGGAQFEAFTLKKTFELVDTKASWDLTHWDVENGRHFSCFPTCQGSAPPGRAGLAVCTVQRWLPEEREGPRARPSALCTRWGGQHGPPGGSSRRVACQGVN